MTDRLRPRSAVAHRRPTVVPASSGETGASLVFVLVILILISTIITALFVFADTGTRAMRAQREGRTVRVTADAALDAGVIMVKRDKTLGVTSTPGVCSLKVPVEPSGTVLAAGSYLVVNCAATSGVTSGGTDGDGGQSLRDVTFTVTCGQTEVGGKVSCGAGGTSKVVGRARVRFDIDYAYDGSSAALPLDARARVPKVVSWSTTNI